MRPARLAVPALVASALLALGSTTATAAASDQSDAKKVAQTGAQNGAKDARTLSLTATSRDDVAPAGASTAAAAAALTTARLSGADRYATSVAISKAHFAPPQEYVIVASGQNFPDALGAGPFGALVQAPLLLVPQTGKLPSSVAAELKRLKTKDVIVVGGPGSVSDGMVRQIEAQSTSGLSYQFAGANRYDTAAQLTDVFEVPLTDVPVYLSSGTTFPDALGGGAAAALDGGFLLLTAPTKLPAETATALRRVKPSNVVVLGGTGAISGSVLTAVRNVVGSGVPVTRIGGTDRYDTAAKVSAATLTSANEVFLANGLQYPDALSGSAVAPAFGGRPVLLTKKDCVPAATRAEIARLGATKITALGGAAMVSDAALKLKAC